ncbi:GLEYA domain-containing protein [Biscogniauxia mediterranea]|nr:GLEYA domain-containing protein [Biscogniauxia mediterranea]
MKSTTTQSLALLLAASARLAHAAAVTYPGDLCPSTCGKPLHCLNAGWDWAYYANPLHNNGNDYPGFSPESFKTKEPVYAGVTGAIGGPVGNASAGVAPIYESSADLNATYFALNQHAYLYACESGAWQFNLTGVDDAAFAWLGDAAYSGWTAKNANATAIWSFTNSRVHLGSSSFVGQLTGGQYYPLRVVFGDGQGAGSFNFTITSPSGVVVHQSGVDSDYLVRFSCDLAQSAPRFPEFGKET